MKFYRQESYSYQKVSIISLVKSKRPSRDQKCVEISTSLVKLYRKNNINKYKCLFYEI